MKKFIFSAVAMMAFSLSSMANNSGVELVDPLAFVESVEVLEVDCWTVAEFAEAAYTFIYPNNQSGAYNAFSHAYTVCAATLNCPSCLSGVTIHLY